MYLCHALPLTGMTLVDQNSSQGKASVYKFDIANAMLADALATQRVSQCSPFHHTQEMWVMSSYHALLCSGAIDKQRIIHDIVRVQNQ